MTTVAELFPSKYMSAADLKGDTPVQIKRIVDAEEVGEEKKLKPIVYFSNWPKGLVLNKTNAKRIMKLYGGETDEWVGKWISVYPSECDYKDDVVACVRVRQEAPSIPDSDDGDGELSDEDLERLLAKRKNGKKKAGAA